MNANLLFINKKSNPKNLNLKLVGKEEKLSSSLIEKKDGMITLISEDRTYYLCLDKNSEDYNFQKIYDFFVDFCKNNERDLNIDIKSFTNSKLNEDSVLQAVSEGILFGTHKVIEYKKILKKIKPTNYCLISSHKSSQKILRRAEIKLEAVNWARDLQDAAPNKLHAKDFARVVKNRFANSKEIQVDVLDKKAIEKNKMGLLLAVNEGSHQEPRVVILRYKGNPKSKEVLGLIGKGITFDTGGYNLKPSSHLQTMKFDMSGAAIVCSVFSALIQEKSKINVTVVACLAENVIGGHATLPESVIDSMNGKTVEINNTDAEGRLVLADGITYGIKKEKITKVVVVASLTGAVLMALGKKLTGVMTNNREFYRELRNAFLKSHERYWELPIIPENVKSLKNNTLVADISNVSEKMYMGASVGAAFLQEFVDGLPFVHCDIGGTFDELGKKLGTGVMVKTLIELLYLTQ